MKPLYIADDYGHAPSIDRAIIELARAHAIDGTSVLVTTRELGHLPALRELPQLRVGLHLCLTWGRAVAPAGRLGSLVRRDGSFGGLDRLARLWLTGRLEHAALRTEIAAQLERLRTGAGRVDFVDGHQHVQLLPPVLRALEEVISSMSLGPLRVRLGLLGAGRLRHRLLLNGLVGLRRAWPRPLPFSSTQRMVDYEGFSEGAACRRSTEVMLHVAHPEVADPSLDATSYSYTERVEQFMRRSRAARGAA